ncbi:MAG: CPBP family intramembrane glutamic endopeptidase [Coriobacteriia bacterium]|nr:CPBP family intramembrane glutamic endopeptidase [Coriobacteriia bacterium]
MGRTESSDARSVTRAGLALALVGAPAYAIVAGPLLVEPRTTTISGSLIGLSVMWLLAAGVVLIVLHGERRALPSIGWIRLPWVHALQAVLIGVGLSLAVPVLSLAVGRVFPAGDAGSIASAARMPWGLVLAAAVTAAVTEEVLFRGYALERMGELLGQRWVGSAIAVASFTITHSAGWNLAHVVGVVLPLGIALTALYWWRRSLPFVMIVHLMIDLPLVVMSAAS